MICKFGPLVSDARGKIGGVVFSRSRAGPFARRFTSPVFDPTNTRMRWSSIYSLLCHWWLEHTSDDDRIDWNTLGSATNYTNALGVMFHPSGWNLFFGTNSLSQFHAIPFALTAPPNAIQTHYEVTYSWNEGNQQIIATRGAGPPADSYYIFRFSHPLPKTVYYNRGPYITWKRQLSSFLVGGIAVTTSGFFSTGDRVFISDRIRKDTGELSAKYFTLFDCEV